MKTSWMKRQQYLGYLFIGPNMVGVMLFYCASLVFVLSHVYGLQIYELGHEVRGTGQYSKMLGDEVFYISIKNTLFFLLSVPVSIGLAFIVAVVLNRSVYLKSAPRLIFHALHHQWRRRRLRMDRCSIRITARSTESSSRSA